MAVGKVDMATMPLTRRHVWVVFVASLGQLIGTGVATLAGVIIPMLNIMSRHDLSTGIQGIIGAMDLIGIVFGSVIFGKLIDRYGYILFFRLCPAIVLAASLFAVFFPTVPVLIISLFFIGFGIGGEYSLDSNYIADLMPVKWKSFMIGLAKTASAFGNIFVAGICYLLIFKWRKAADWPSLMWIVTAISGLMLLCRIRFYQSPKWLESHGKMQQAEKALEEFLGPNVELSPIQKPATSDDGNNGDNDKSRSGSSFYRNNWKEIILTGIPWACEGLGVYGIGVFLPILVMSLGIEHVEKGEIPILHVASSVEVTFFISCIILPGFLLGLYLLHRRCNQCKMQSWGFWLCAISLGVLMAASHFHWPKWISVIAFMAFELFLNMGPHLITYVLPPKVFPLRYKGYGAGLAASIGKVGAVLGVFVIPVLLKWGGSDLVLLVSIAVMAAGAVVTTVFAKLLKID